MYVFSNDDQQDLINLLNLVNNTIIKNIKAKQKYSTLSQFITHITNQLNGSTAGVKNKKLPGLLAGYIRYLHPKAQSNVIKNTPIDPNTGFIIAPNYDERDLDINLEVAKLEKNLVHLLAKLQEGVIPVNKSQRLDHFERFKTWLQIVRDDLALGDNTANIVYSDIQGLTSEQLSAIAAEEVEYSNVVVAGKPTSLSHASDTDQLADDEPTYLIKSAGGGFVAVTANQIKSASIAHPVAKAQGSSDSTSKKPMHNVAYRTDTEISLASSHSLLSVSSDTKSGASTPVARGYPLQRDKSGSPATSQVVTPGSVSLNNSRNNLLSYSDTNTASTSVPVAATISSKNYSKSTFFRKPKVHLAFNDLGQSWHISLYQKTDTKVGLFVEADLISLTPGFIRAIVQQSLCSLGMQQATQTTELDNKVFSEIKLTAGPNTKKKLNLFRITQTTIQLLDHQQSLNAMNLLGMLAFEMASRTAKNIIILDNQRQLIANIHAEKMTDNLQRCIVNLNQILPVVYDTTMRLICGLVAEKSIHIMVTLTDIVTLKNQDNRRVEKTQQCELTRHNNQLNVRFNLDVSEKMYGHMKQLLILCQNSFPELHIQVSVISSQEIYRACCVKSQQGKYTLDAYRKEFLESIPNDEKLSLQFAGPRPEFDNYSYTKPVIRVEVKP